MKILFTTDVGDRAGVGGHLYTIRSMVEALAPHADCVVVSLGRARSPGLESLACPKYQVAFGPGISRRGDLSRFMEVVAKEKPDVIHAFDPVSCAFARVASRKAGCGLVLTLCGGPNPAGRFPYSFYPKIPHLVVFSRENERFFMGRHSFRKTRIWRIPQRTNEVPSDPVKVAALRARLDPARLVLLRVGRISPTYGKTAEMSIRLVERLQQDGLPVQLVFLGIIQDPRAEAAILASMGDRGLIVSEADLVARASLVLDAADVVVGTGRGLMEAAARGRILLVPARTGQLPALIDESNWHDIFDANFSERSEIVPWDEELNYRKIKMALLDPEYRRSLSGFSRQLYEDQFSLQRALPQYLALYEAARGPERGRYADLALHWLSMVWRTHARYSTHEAVRPAGERGAS